MVASARLLGTDLLSPVKPHWARSTSHDYSVNGGSLPVKGSHPCLLKYECGNQRVSFVAALVILASVQLQLPSTTEILGFLTGAVCVWLLVKENIWSWPIGIANNIFYIVVFWWAKLYADMGLQFFYIVISIYGWWNWLHGGRNRSELSVTQASARAMIGYSALVAASTGVLYWVLHRYTPSTVPLGDGLSAALFLTAQYMMSRKVVENWWLWIVGNFLAIGLFYYKGLFLTAMLYTIFLLMCVLGLREWRRAAQQEGLTVPVAEAERA